MPDLSLSEPCDEIDIEDTGEDELDPVELNLQKRNVHSDSSDLEILTDSKRNISPTSPYFSKEDFLSLSYFPGCSHQQEERRLESHRNLKNKLAKIDHAIWPRLSYYGKKFGRVRKKREFLWWAYYPSPDMTKTMCLNFFLGKHGLHALANAELTKPFTRVLKNIRDRSDEFDELMQSLQLDENFYALIYTRLPLLPENNDNFYIKKQFRIPKADITADAIISAIEFIEENFDTIIKEMLSDVESSPYYDGKKDTQYFRKTFCGPNAKVKQPLSSCIIRFNYLFPKDEIVALPFEQLTQDILDVEHELRKVIEFANV